MKEPLRTPVEARAALVAELADVDNAVAATRALYRVLARFEPEAPASRDAFRHRATKLLDPYFQGKAKATVWAAFDAVRSGDSGDPDEWDEATPLGPPEPDPLPLEVLPHDVARHVKSVAAATQTPADVGALLSLAAVSTAVHGKVEVQVRPMWRERVNIYAAAILPPAARKSAVYRYIVGPLEEWEADQARATEPERMAAEDQREVLEKRLEAAKRAAAKGDLPPEAVEAARFDLLEAKVPAVTRLNAPSATPERLVQLMAEQGGRMAVLAPEGDSLRIADGRYSGQGDARLDTLKRAWSGEMIREDRVGREGEVVRRPALTLALCLQPSVLGSLEHRTSMRGEGVLGRILWCEPDSGIGTRLTGEDVPRADHGAAEAWATILSRLLASSPADVDEDDGSFVPHLLQVEDDARAVLYAWEAEVEGELLPGGRLSGVQDWGGKLVGQTVRLAALLQLAARAADGAPLWEPVGTWAMEGAVDLARTLSTHALKVFGDLDLDPTLALARYVFGRALDLPEGSTLRDLFQATKSKTGLSTMEDLEEALELVMDHGLLRLRERPREGPGRPYSPYIEIHPDHSKTAPIILRKEEIGNYEDCGDGNRGSVRTEEEVEA